MRGETRIRQMIPRENIWIPMAEQTDGAKIRIRRRKRYIRGIVVGPAQPKELEYIKEHYPDIAEKAGIV